MDRNNTKIQTQVYENYERVFKKNKNKRKEKNK